MLLIVFRPNFDVPVDENQGCLPDGTNLNIACFWFLEMVSGHSFSCSSLIPFFYKDL